MPEKLAIITGSDIRLFGGEERYIIELAKSLKDLDITIFSGKVAGISSDKKETIKNLGLNLVFYDSVKIPVTLETLPLSSSFLLSLKNFDYIYLTDPSLPTLSLVLLFSGKHPKIIFGMHNANSIRSKSIKGGLFWDLLVKVYSPIQRSVLFKVPNIHVLNNEDYSILKRLGYPHRIYPIKNFIFFRPEKVQENNKFIILFVGRLVPYQKGIDLLDQITKHILSLDKNIEFHIVGTGTSEGRQIVKGLVRRNSQIKWLKTLSDAKLKSEYKKASVLLFPSRFEVFSLVLLEAQAYGLPIVAFDVKGPRDLITNDFQGKLIPFPDTDSFSHELCNYHNLWKSNGREYTRIKASIQRNIFKKYGKRQIMPQLKNMFTQ